MSDINELSACELEDVVGGKDSDPFRVIHLPWGGYCAMYRIPESHYRNQIPNSALHEGDHYVITGEPVNEMYPIRSLKNNICGYIHDSFVHWENYVRK